MDDKKFMKENGAILKLVGKAAIAAMVVIMLGCMLLTTFTISGSLGKTGYEYGTIILLFVAALCGNLLFRQSNMHRKWLALLAYASMIVGVLLVMNLAVFNGRFSAAPVKIMAIYLGAMIGLLGSGGGRGKKRKFTKGKLYKSHNR